MTGFDMKKNFFGEQPKIVKQEKRVNPELNRTQATGNEQGITKGTNSAINIIQNGVVRLKNRSVPLNGANPKNRRRVPRMGGN